MMLIIRTRKRDKEILRRANRMAWQAGFDTAVRARGLAGLYLEYSKSWCAASNSVIDQCNKILEGFDDL